jgi:hypothetical protein
MDVLTGYSVYSSDRSVVHHPTAAFFRYDRVGHLTMLNPHIHASEDIHRITRGAEEALRKELERDLRIKFEWLGNTGRTAEGS